MKSLKWALIQYNWCPYKKGKLERSCTYDMNTKGEDGHLQDKNRSLGMKLILPTT